MNKKYFGLGIVVIVLLLIYLVDGYLEPNPTVTKCDEIFRGMLKQYWEWKDSNKIELKTLKQEWNDNNCNLGN